MEEGSSLVVKGPPTGLTEVAPKPLPIVPMTLHPTRATLGAVNAITPPNSPKKP